MVSALSLPCLALSLAAQVSRGGPLGPGSFCLPAPPSLSPGWPCSLDTFRPSLPFLVVQA